MSRNPPRPANDPQIAAAFDIKRLDQAFLDDPYPTYRALREHDPVHRMPDGSYFLTRYDDLVEVYRDAAAWSSDKKLDFKPHFGSSPIRTGSTSAAIPIATWRSAGASTPAPAIRSPAWKRRWHCTSWSADSASSTASAILSAAAAPASAAFATTEWRWSNSDYSFDQKILSGALIPRPRQLHA
jgi:hypothetical protein